jgi:hypothetical protein
VLMLICNFYLAVNNICLVCSNSWKITYVNMCITFSLTDHTEVQNILRYNKTDIINELMIVLSNFKQRK